MAGSFTIGALAIARREANAVGAVRLTLLPKRLEIELLLVGAYQESFVPGALTRSVRMSAPYTAVRGLVRRGDTVVLTLDPRVVTPHNRFALTQFTDLPLEALAAAHRRRLRAGVLATVLPAPLGIAAAAMVPAELASGWVGRGAFGVLVLLVAGLALRLFVRYRSWGGPLEDHLRDVFEHRLAQRLAIAPPASYETDPFELPPDIELERDEPMLEAKVPASYESRAAGPIAQTIPGPLPPLGTTSNELADDAASALGSQAPVPAKPRPMPGVVRRALLAAALVVTALGAFAVYRRIVLIGSASVRPSSSVSEAVEGDAPESSASAAPTAPSGPSCKCERADSPLWKDGLPALTLIPISRQRDEAGRPASNIAPIVKKGVPRYDFDMAVVNDAAIPLKDVRVVLTFARRNSRGERTNVTDRGLFWEGELGPGRSVKWNVEAPGSEVRIDVDEQRKLGELAPAPADTFVRLLAARQQSVRLHATVMLAYLGDARARDAAQTLEGLSESDEQIKEAVVRATSPLRTCGVKVTKGDLEACIENTSENEVAALDVVEIAPGGTGRKAPIEEALPGHSGRKIVLHGFGEAPEEVALQERKSDR